MGSADANPRHFALGVANVQREPLRLLGRAVEVERRRLDPRIVRVSRLVDVTAEERFVAQRLVEQLNQDSQLSTQRPWGQLVSSLCTHGDS